DHHHLNRRMLLSISVDSALALFVARRVPSEVIVNDGVEMILQVDALAETVSAHEDPFGFLAESHDALLAIVWRKEPGDRLDGHVLERLSEVLRDVLRGRNEPAENDRSVTLGDELPDLGSDVAQLHVVLGT